jgi:hypothetical protein
MDAVAGRRDRALGCDRRRPTIVVGLEEHHRPRAIEGALPGRVLCVRNAETPSRSARAFRGERSADRKESSTPRREQDDQERTPAAERQRETATVLISALLLMVAHNRPDTDPLCSGAKAR